MYTISNKSSSIILLLTVPILSIFYRVYENGKETIMSYENDILKSKTVNGVPQSITYS